MRYAIRGNEVTVPNLVGKTLPDGSLLVNASALHLKVESYRFDDQVPKDHIISQIPYANSRIKRDRNVRAIISLGAKRVPVPDLSGESLRASQILLLKRGLTFGVTSLVSSESFEKDRIISQDPLAETQLAQSPLMSVLVSTGRRPREYLMPDLIGNILEDVTEEMSTAGLTVGTLNYQPVPGLLKGTILRQNPLPGTKLVDGSSIDFEVCK